MPHCSSYSSKTYLPTTLSRLLSRFTAIDEKSSGKGTSKKRDCGGSVNDDVDMQELEDLSDDCVVAVQGGSGPTMTPP